MTTNRAIKTHWGKVAALLLIGLMLSAPMMVLAQSDEEQPYPLYLPAVQSASQPQTNNQPPKAVISLSTITGTAPLQVDFSARDSWDEDGSLTRYSWGFGDGGTDLGMAVQHSYTKPGSYTAWLTVTDDRGGMAQALVRVLVNAPVMATKNVILFIGDGMGFEHVRAGGMYLNGAAGTLSFESFPQKAEMSTRSASSVTDSAAAATAMATGVKVQNKTISLDIPGDGKELYTILEYAHDHDLSTGLVTTTFMTHATPAGFGAHTTDRNDWADIARDYLKQTRPNLLFGGGGAEMTPDAALAAGYSLLTDRAGLLALDTESLRGREVFLSGQFGSSDIPYETDGVGALPHLSQMTAAALNILDNDPDGFFLMVEGGRIDHASHANEAEHMVGEVAEFSRAVQAALNWAKQHPDTLILVVADHETGGLKISQNNGRGNVPSVTWSSTAHTGTTVPVYLYGKYSGTLPRIIDNTQVPDLLSGGKFP